MIDEKKTSFLVLGQKSKFAKKLLADLEETGIILNTSLGQHVLTSEKVLDFIGKQVKKNDFVIEVGAGPGNLTKVLVENAAKVVSIEIDHHYEKLLLEMGKRYRNLEVLFGNAISLNFKDVLKQAGEKKRKKIVASLPYHITEPFLHKLIGLPIDSAVLVVGADFARAGNIKDEDHKDFGLRSLLISTFFDFKVLMELDKKLFFPVPRTNSAIVRLVPRKSDLIKKSFHDRMFRRLFLTSEGGSLVKNCLKEAIIEWSSQKMTQNQARDLLAKKKISETILNKSFGQLNNDELRIISKAMV